MSEKATGSADSPGSEPYPDPGLERAYQAWQHACRNGLSSRDRLFKAYIDLVEARHDAP
jgi:hypothetical protein